MLSDKKCPSLKKALILATVAFFFVLSLLLKVNFCVPFLEQFLNAN